MTGASTATACDGCLRRADLIGALAGRLDVQWRRRESAPARVLALADEALLALDPTGAAARGYASFDPAAARARAARAGLTVLCRCGPGYPDRLRDLVDPPAVLHVLGDPEALHVVPAAAVVGARRASAYGLEVARSLGRGLSAAGVPVVSGLALGVDGAAHAGALEAPAPLVAVLAGPAEVPYPARSRGLHARIAARGCVVSELPPGHTARRWCFVARNRIIAALADATVIVEAAERSGSLTTAGFAEELGRGVAAVPGQVTSRLAAGTNALIVAGAHVVRDARDVLDLVFGAGGGPIPAPTMPDPLLGEPHLRALLAAIEDGRGTLAELAATPEQAAAALRGLTELELRGLVRRGFGGRYVRAGG